MPIQKYLCSTWYHSRPRMNAIQASADQRITCKVNGKFFSSSISTRPSVRGVPPKRAGLLGGGGSYLALTIERYRATKTSPINSHQWATKPSFVGPESGTSDLRRRLRGGDGGAMTCTGKFRVCVSILLMPSWANQTGRTRM